MQIDLLQHSCYVTFSSFNWYQLGCSSSTYIYTIYEFIIMYSSFITMYRNKIATIGDDNRLKNRDYVLFVSTGATFRHNEWREFRQASREWLVFPS